MSTAADVLNENWRGTHTVPSGGLYPHQWSWDSAFIAIGLRHVSPKRARLELETLLKSQWPDGRLPQIVFDLSRDNDYFPGAAFWGASTAGLIQPPNHAIAALLVHEAEPDLAFLGRVYPHLVAWHHYLLARRTGESGLAHIVHPWESGLDNSPYWDAPLAAIGETYRGELARPDLLHAAATERPSNAEYGKYLYLAERYRDHDCDDEDAEYPFRLEDPLVNALWAKSELALAQIARALGLDPAPHEHRAASITAALETLWSPELGTYTARDIVSAQLQPYRTVAGIIPLILPDIAHAADLLAALDGPHFALGRVALVPSHDLTADTFDASLYWRGPSWFNTAWLLVDGLELHGRSRDAAALAAQTIELAERCDYPEYIDPHSDAPRGTRRFSWTAALAIDLAER